MTAPKANPFQQVLVACQRVDMRSTIREALKEMGGMTIQDATGIQDAWKMLEVINPPDWIVATLDLDESINAFHLLALLVKEPLLKNTRVSLIVSPSETDLLPAAFELGALSFHATPFTKSSLISMFEDLFNSVNDSRSPLALTAARYLRECLAENNRFSELIALEEKLINRYPDTPELFIKLAEAQYMDSRHADAKRTLLQAKHLGADLSFAAGQLETLITSEAPELSQDHLVSTFSIAFDLKCCVIVDPDQTSCSPIANKLKEMGVGDVVTFADGAEAISWLEKEGPRVGLILQEWRIPKVSGPAFLQRLRRQFCPYTPVIIISSLINKEDAYLIKEIGASAIVNKPLRTEELSNTIMAVVRASKFPTEGHALEVRFRQAVQSKDAGVARNALAALKAVADYPLSCLMIAEAELAFLEGEYETAKELAIEGLKTQNDSFLALHLLGKILLKLGDHENSFKFFSRAERFCSKNIERLCLIAETLTEKDSEGAEEAMQKAQALDAENPLVVEKSAELAINSGQTEKARRIMDKMPVISNVLSYMNSKAISLAVRGEFAQAVQIYQDVLNSLPMDREGEKASVLYNLALAYGRMGKTSDAGATLKAIDIGKAGELAKRITALARRIDEAERLQKPLQLSLGQSKQQEKNEQGFLMPVAFHAFAGEICLHLIYQVEGEPNETVRKSLSRTPHFGRREQETLVRRAN